MMERKQKIELMDCNGCLSRVSIIDVCLFPSIGTNSALNEIYLVIDRSTLSPPHNHNAADRGGCQPFFPSLSSKMLFIFCFSCPSSQLLSPFAALNPFNDGVPLLITPPQLLTTSSTQSTRLSCSANATSFTTASTIAGAQTGRSNV